MRAPYVWFIVVTYALYGYSDIRSFMGGPLVPLNLKDVAVGIGSLSNTQKGMSQVLSRPSGLH